jgi:hypothetical protein
MKSVRVFVWSGCLRLERSEQQASRGDACLLTTTGCQRNAPSVVAQLIVARVISAEVTKPHSPTQQVKKSRKSSTPLNRGKVTLGGLLSYLNRCTVYVVTKNKAPEAAWGGKGNSGESHFIRPIQSIPSQSSRRPLPPCS